MIVVYRRRKNEIDRDWHFHTQCPRWPEKDFEQRRYLEAREGERLCGECARLESEMSLQKSRIEYEQLARDIQRADQYIKERVKEGMSELEAEDRAVELILAPSDGPQCFAKKEEAMCRPRLHVLARLKITLVTLAAIFAASLTFAQDTVRVRGTIERVEGQAFVVKSREGAELKVVLADNALVVAIVKASISDIKPGSFVGVTGIPQADGSQRAIEVHIFPEAMRGTGEGHYSWDLRPQSTMTNASVVNIEQAVTEVNGRVLSMKYKDGEKKIVVPANAPIVTYVPSDKSELKPGVQIFILAAKKLPDGTLQAPRINFGKDGLTPPM